MEQRRTELNNRPLVSVITIFFNSEKFIRETIESLFGQTYDNWEFLLVDDGSNDGSTGIALQLAAQHPEKVRYFEHDGHRNRGMSASWNVGLCNARGEYIALLDADDVWLPEKLERQVSRLNSNPSAGMIYGPSQYWFSWTGSPEDSLRDFVPRSGLETNALVYPPTLLTLCLKGETPMLLPCNAIFRRKTAEKAGRFEEAFRGGYSDQVFFTKIYLQSPVYVSAECLSRHRKHPDSLTATILKEGRVDSMRLDFLTWVERYLSEQDVRNVDLLHALDEELWPFRHLILFRAQRWAQDQLRKAKRLFGQARMSAIRIKRAVLQRSAGSITAKPNPIQARDNYGAGEITTLSWMSRETKMVEVRVDSCDGPLFSRTGPSGTATTGRWVTDGMTFYLQDVSDGLPLSSVNTLAAVTIRVLVPGIYSSQITYSKERRRKSRPA